MKKIVTILAIIFVLVLGLTLALLLRKPAVKVVNTTKIATPSASFSPSGRSQQSQPSNSSSNQTPAQQPGSNSQSTTVINQQPEAQPTQAPAPTNKPLINIPLPPIIKPVLSL